MYVSEHSYKMCSAESLTPSQNYLKISTFLIFQKFQRFNSTLLNSPCLNIQIKNAMQKENPFYRKKLCLFSLKLCN